MGIEDGNGLGVGRYSMVYVGRLRVSTCVRTPENGAVDRGGRLGGKSEVRPGVETVGGALGVCND